MESGNKKVLITGVAGFIGMHTARSLCRAGYNVHGVDNLNPYYDPQLKRDRLSQLTSERLFTFDPIDITAREEMKKLFSNGNFNVVESFAKPQGIGSFYS